jgi:tetratricopeptide (TPR) repeat protein
LDSAILLDPTNASAFREKSVWFTKTGDYVNAYSLLNKAVELDPFDALGYRGWLKLYKLHDFKGALLDFSKLDSLTPGITDYAWGENINYVKGIAEKELGMNEQALADFNRYIDEVKKKQGESWVDLYAFIDKGVVLRKMNKVDSAILNFDKAIKYYERCPEPYFEKGITFIKINDYKSAIYNLNKALELFNKGYARNDPYKDYSNQLYAEEIEKQISNCSTVMNTNKN